MIMKFRIACVLIFLFPTYLDAQHKVLSIGDKMPNVKIKNVLYYPRQDIDISDFKGKLIILDFWGKYCSSCLAVLPRIQKLQEEFNGQLQVITVADHATKEDLQRTLQRYKPTQNLRLPVVLNDVLLKQYFPHQLVSHVVWIGGDGIVKAITGTEYVTKENISKLLNKEKIDWPVKKDVFQFDYKKPFVSFSQPEVVKPSFLFTSSFSGYLDGVSPPIGRQVDSANATATISFYNHSILSFCRMAIDYGGGGKDDLILQVKDSSRYIRKKSEYYTEWARKYAYCYSITLPITISEKESVLIVKEDILRWLNVLGVYVRKEDGKYIISERN